MKTLNNQTKIRRLEFQLKEFEKDLRKSNHEKISAAIINRRKAIEFLQENIDKTITWAEVERKFKLTRYLS